MCLKFIASIRNLQFRLIEIQAESFQLDIIEIKWLSWFVFLFQMIVWSWSGFWIHFFSFFIYLCLTQTLLSSYLSDTLRPTHNHWNTHTHTHTHLYKIKQTTNINTNTHSFKQQNPFKKNSNMPSSSKNSFFHIIHSQSHRHITHTYTDTLKTQTHTLP